MKSISQKRGAGKIKVIERREAVREINELNGIDDIDVRVSLIRALIPIGLKEVTALLQEEVLKLAGPAKKHGKVNRRWGRQGGSVYLYDQKIPIDVPRVRNKATNSEVPLESYRKFQQVGATDEKIFVQLLNGLSTHKYEESAALAPQVFGLSASNVSKRFRRQSVKYLEALMARRLDEYDFAAMFIDGKVFAKEGIVIALGITINGEKIILGLEQMNSENSVACGQFYDKLIKRGLKYEQGLLFIVDGGKGIGKAIDDKFKEHNAIQRCQQHKKENVARYLPLSEQKIFRIKMNQAYGQESYDGAKAALDKICGELDRINPSASASLREGMSDTLTLHRLGLNQILARSFSSTNCIESVMSQVGQYTDKVDCWRNGRHIQEWVAAGLMKIEPHLNKVNGWRHLRLLRERLQEDIRNRTQKQSVAKTELITVGV